MPPTNLHVKPKVLEEDDVIDWVEYVIRVAYKHGCAQISSVEGNRAQVIGEVAADWLSRLLGEARVIHLTSGDRTEAEAAVCSV